jgi:hypothetical protein
MSLQTRSGLRFRQPEVEQLRASFRKHHVARLQIAVRDTEPVRGVERAGDLDRYLERIVQRKTGAPRGTRKAGRECLALKVLHDEKCRARVVADVVQGAHLSVVQMRKRLRLAFETFAEFGICCEVRRQDFDSDRALEAQVFRAIDLTHTARAEWRLYFVRAESCACV